jgi:tRNA(Ile)-lysidine synthase
MFMFHPSARAWLDQIERFALEHELWGHQHSLALAISGGPDSTAMAYLVAYLLQQKKIKGARLLHVNHGHRPLTELDEQKVIALGKKLRLSVDIIDLKLKDGANFEQRARKARHHALKSLCAQDELLLSAHHLDDSFEWWLASHLKSSKQHVLGIPVINGRWRRPFMCVTKKQILHFLSLNNQDFVQDPTSHLLHLERNYLRSKVMPALDERYPRRLRHYVRRQNALALEWGEHCLSKRSEEIQLRVLSDGVGGVLMAAREWNAASETTLSYELRRLIEELSDQKRGALHEEVLKTIRAVAQHKKGPHRFSGGVCAYLLPGAIYLMHESDLEKIQELDQVYSFFLSSGSQIPNAMLEQCLLAPLIGADRGPYESTFKTNVFDKVWAVIKERRVRYAYAYQAFLSYS